MAAELQGKRVLIVTSNTGVEHDELVVPRDRLRERGAEVTHAAAKAEQVQTFRSDVQPDSTEEPDAGLDGVHAEDFDVLVVPGGTVNADKLRVADGATDLVREFIDSGKPIAAICHGPWVLVEAGVLPGKTLTSYHSVRTDIVNAGGEWVDRPAVRSDENGWTLITSRNPNDLPDFVDTITEELTTAR
ncbi:type 1 glutamine amidotransferase domain-containing protein [Nocardia transvalensis]|uniref:type 1 glutamine amidotransferase domain-containing protein n=1 Tax=Nocardia transvalensis TaxID=37333 RepID=UPI001894A592|nr:type 1 glutamine amidotransferase domain-containing protein [Nocardia transvalensis]MBF6328033.1 type 1 glutamine amidotransferase [Nocardia transvalensis]